MTINDSLTTTTEIFADFNQLLSSISKTHQPNTPLTSSHPIIKHFRKWLISKKLSDKTIKNYASDVKQFLADLGRLPHSADDFLSYILKLRNKKVRRSTINRKLSSLRRFSIFIHQTYAIVNFSDQLQNIPQDPAENLLKNFRSHLKKKGHKSKTITNYLSDVRGYLTWATSNDE